VIQMKSKSLAIVVGFDPFRKVNGDSIRFFSWLNYLRGSDYQIELYIVGQSLLNTDQQMSLADYPKDFKINFFEQESSQFPILKRINNHFRAIRLGAPPWIAATYSKLLHAKINNMPSSMPLILIGEAAGLYFPFKRSSSILWDKSNVLSFSTLSEAKDVSSLFQKIKYLYHSSLAKRFERIRLNSECWVTATSAPEILRIEQLSDGRNVHLLRSANGPYQPVKLDLSSTKIGWIGSFNYGPNWRGLIRFLAVADSFLTTSGYRLKVMGAGVSPKQRAYLDRFTSVDFVGYVEKVEEEISDCKFLLVPLWSGAGIKIKSLDALKHGVPLLTTVVGGEGIRHDAILHTFEDPNDLEFFLSKIDVPTIEENLRSAKSAYLDEHTQEAFNGCLSRILDAFIASQQKD